MKSKKSAKVSSRFSEFKTLKPWHQLTIDFGDEKQEISELQSKTSKDSEQDKVDVDLPEEL